MRNPSTEPAGRRPTMTDVARLAGVSVKTVSRVINNVATVDDVLAGRVREASERLGYRPNQVAASLRAGRATGTIGVLVKDVSNAMYATIVAGATSVAEDRKTRVITAHTGENSDAELAVIDDLCRRRVDGLLIVPSGGDHASLRQEIDHGVPMVFVDRAPSGLEADSVLIDNYGGSKSGVARLIASGHSKIGIILDKLSQQTMSERLAGAQAAFAEAGMSLDSDLIRTSVSNPAEAAAAAAELIQSRPAPTAFFCGNNRLAVGVLELLWDGGYDHALLGFDDIPHARLMPRPVSCIVYDSRVLGMISAKLLFRRIDGEEFSPKTVTLPTQVIDYRGTHGDQYAAGRRA
ncbi:LacI family DNA-binding transcriptional regulator [Streptomyces hygroscopicus]|uniref:LacI family DNA-binding transcriptional regulator n=1 Tax=Streptomyces hygroscopicus TaxID=1912 RepID=UPI00379775B2